MVYKINLKKIDKRNLTVPQYIALYRANPALWAYEQTKTFYDPTFDVVYTPHHYQKQVMNLTYSNKLTVVLKCRQCIVAGTKIHLVNDEYIRIEDLLKEFSKKQFFAKSVFQNKIVEDKIIDVWSVGEKNVYSIYLDNNIFPSLTCTLKHKINTPFGFKKLEELKPIDKIFVVENNVLKTKTITNISYEGKKTCYDLTTEKYHNYLANTISVHNSGFSTGLAAMFAHDVLFGLTKGILFVSISKFHAEELMEKFYHTIDTIIDPRFRLTYVNQTKSYCKFTNGIKVRSLSSNPDTMIGFTGTILWDEAGKFSIEESQKIANTLFPSITTPGTRLYIISTPFGKGNVFHKMCKSPETLSSDVKHVSKRFFKVHWKDVPHVARQIDMLRATFDNETLFKMAYCCEFGEDSVDALFPYDFLRDYAYPFEEIIPFDLDKLLLKDSNNNYIYKDSPLYH